MVDTKSGPIEFVRGVVEDALGRAKQVIGIIIGHNDLINEGKAQQDKAEAAQCRAEGSRSREGPRQGQNARVA
jgi:uncharacterized protein YjbJ (UPF0337 family)